MASGKPAIVIVPGAWHVPSHYSKLESGLKQAGYEVKTVRNPSAGPPEPFPNMSPDVDAVQDAVKAFIDRGLDVVMAMHSIGGVIGCAAAKGLRPEDQANGKGIIALVYLSAFVVPEGKSMMDLRPKPEHAPWIRLKGEMASGNTFMCCDAQGPDTPKEVFYNDCSPEDQQAAIKDLQWNFSEAVCHDRSSCGPYRDIESNYLICELDVAIPAQVQEYMSSTESGKWKRVERLKSGHSPFLSRPDETVAFVRRCAGEDI